MKIHKKIAKAVMAVGLFMVLIALLFLLFFSLGYRLNLTASMPQGVYKITGDKPQRGDTVIFCLDSDNLFTTLAKERGYIGPGSCVGGMQPLLKILVGLPGDTVTVTLKGIVVNGQLLANTVRPKSDSQGRPMPPSLLQSGDIPQGLALVIAQEHGNSFDSRHFGLIPQSGLQVVNGVLLIY